MVVTPDSRIILLKSPLKLDNNNQITFATASDQYSYFYGLTKLEHSAFSYIRKDGVVRIPTHKEANDDLPVYEDLLEYNYCMYQNTHYKNKWFYAFITDISYLNDGMTEIKLETDAFQTWQFDLTYMNSFIEREHVASDNVGEHTIPERIEHGPYIAASYTEIASFSQPSSYIIIGTTWLPSNTPNITSAQIYGGVFSGVYYLAFESTGTYAKNFILALDGLGRGEAIVTVFMAPSSILGNLTAFQGDLVSKESLMDGTVQSKTFHIEGYFVGNDLSGKYVGSDTTVTNVTAIDGYTPKNKKVLCYPYTYLLLTNNNGANAEFHYEDFISNTATFSIISALSPGCSIKCFPKNYKKLADGVSSHPGYNDGIMAGKLPICSWQNDSFTNWMTQQSVNVTMNQVQAAANIGAMALSGGQIGAGGGLFTQQANYVSERYQHALVPPQSSGSLNGGDVTFALGESIAYYKMTIKSEYAKIVDEFFTQFGYQVNRLATPNIHKRSNWDYMKTTSINLEGNVPEKELNVIRNLFNSGCTFWHTTSKFLDYSQTNSILS